MSSKLRLLRVNSSFRVNYFSLSLAFGSLDSLPLFCVETHIIHHYSVRVHISVSFWHGISKNNNVPSSPIFQVALHIFRGNESKHLIRFNSNGFIFFSFDCRTQCTKYANIILFRYIQGKSSRRLYSSDMFFSLSSGFFVCILSFVKPLSPSSHYLHLSSFQGSFYIRVMYSAFSAIHKCIFRVTKSVCILHRAFK